MRLREGGKKVHYRQNEQRVPAGLIICLGHEMHFNSDSDSPCCYIITLHIYGWWEKGNCCSFYPPITLSFHQQNYQMIFERDVLRFCDKQGDIFKCHIKDGFLSKAFFSYATSAWIKTLQKVLYKSEKTWKITCNNHEIWIHTAFWNGSFQNENTILITLTHTRVIFSSASLLSIW